jgi:hypothetical protein
MRYIPRKAPEKSIGAHQKKYSIPPPSIFVFFPRFGFARFVLLRFWAFHNKGS